MPSSNCDLSPSGSEAHRTGWSARIQFRLSWRHAQVGGMLPASSEHCVPCGQGLHDDEEDTRSSCPSRKCMVQRTENALAFNNGLTDVAFSTTFGGFRRPTLPFVRLSTDSRASHTVGMTNFLNELEDDRENTSWLENGAQRKYPWASMQCRAPMKDLKHLAVICTAGTEKTLSQCRKLENAMRHLGWEVLVISGENVQLVSELLDLQHFGE